MSNNDERILPVQYLQQYGKYLSTQYPILTCIIYNYYHYELDQIIKFINKIKYYSRKRSEYINILTEEYNLSMIEIDELLSIKSIKCPKDKTCNFITAIKNKRIDSLNYTQRFSLAGMIFLQRRITNKCIINTDILANDNSKLPKEIPPRIYEELALACAEDTECLLKIEEVPMMMSWTINENNSYETIEVL